jgi:hypothetical protein
MTVEFAKKLRLTAQALGCVSQKELCARFLEINPNTQFRLANSYKWIQGRALPRSGAVYEDWARLLGLGKSAQFLTSCSLSEFVEALTAQGQHINDSSIVGEGDDGAFSLATLLQGNYAMYSLAWSKAARGLFVRGSLEIAAGSGNEIFANYSERVAGGILSFNGQVSVSHRAIHIILHDKKHQSSVLLSCHTPAPPANIITGIMAGSAYHDPESRPMAVRLICVRKLTARGDLTASNRYLESGLEEFEEDIVALGYRLNKHQSIGAICSNFLRPPNSQERVEISLAESEDLAMTFDQHLLPRNP